MDIHAKWFFLASVGILLNLYLILLAGRFFSSGWIVLAIAALCAIYYFSDRFDVLDMIPAVLLYYVPLWLTLSGLALYDLVVNFPRLRLPCNRIVLTITSINLSVALLAGMVLLTR